MKIVILLIVALVLLNIIVLLKDFIKYHAYYCRKRMVILQMNNDYVRNILRGNGFILDDTAKINCLPSLYTLDGITIYGFDESSSLMLDNAKSSHMMIVNCGASLGLFIYEIHKLSKR